MDEIPTALREIESSPKSTTNVSRLSLILVSAIGIMSILGFYLIRNAKPIQQANSNNFPLQPIITETTTAITKNNQNAETESSPDTTSINTETEPQIDNILGHLPYQEAPLNELKSITSDGRIRLRAKAADKFKAMQEDARRSGVIIVPISGFRSVAEQEYLFFGIKEQRKQVVSKRAEVSAPPGYSEHHTGYAVDIGDGNAPATNLSTRFEQTPAYNWLASNAAKYSFELSFTPNNLQGVNYEPWHWRYVGDTDSLKTFYQAHNLKGELLNDKLNITP